MTRIVREVDRDLGMGGKVANIFGMGKSRNCMASRDVSMRARS